MNNIKPKISIIVPVYKAEKYIHRCVDSIIAQTASDFELLLINDGSPDDSGKFCDEYANIDKRVKVCHKENSGVSAARNTGLDIMNGEFVLFLDSDDWLDINCLEFCINEMIRTGADMMQFPTERTNKEYNDTTIREIKRGKTFDTSKYIAADDFFVCIGGSVIRTDIIRSNNIRFRSDIKLAEDQLFIMECLRFSQLVYRLDYPFYKYYINEASATNNSKSYTMIDSINALVEYKNKYPIYESRIDYTLYYFLWNIIKNNDIPHTQVCRVINKTKIKDNRKFSKVEKIFIFLGNRIPILSIYFFKIYKFLKS